MFALFCHISSPGRRWNHFSTSLHIKLNPSTIKQQQSKMNRTLASSSQPSTMTSGPRRCNQDRWWNSPMTVRNRELIGDYIRDDGGVVSHTSKDSTCPTHLAGAWSTNMTLSMNDLLSEDEDLDPVQEVHMHVPGSKQRLDTNVFVCFDLCY
jgi:hypothetical protein